MRRALLIGVSLALFAAAPASAQTGLDEESLAGLTSLRSYSPEDGLSAKVSGPTVTFSFTNRSRRALRAFRGHRVLISCDASPSLNPLAISQEPSKVRRVKVGKRATKLKVRIPFASSYDICTAVAVIGKRFYIISAPTTAKGELTLAESKIAADITGALILIFDMAVGDRAPTIDAAVAKLGTLIVALPDASATPALGKIGYWSDGDQHLVVAAMSPSGRRLFFEAASNGVIAENIEPLLMFSLLDL